ncbi:MAG: cytochrome c biogenesis protein ResB [Candidatus Wallbacteria bacterium]|nr:cytochrome c biogenesis protein ResB [Candidatus Wallbacteria bacterium]
MASEQTPATLPLSKRLFQFVCSIRFTIFLLVALAIILAVATVIESREGTGAVQMKVYRAVWFNIFLGGFTLNLLGGTYKRFRWLWIYFGFGVTHLGVLTILLGAFLTRNFGIEGQMTIPQDATREHFVGNDDKLSVTAPDGENVSLFVPIDRGSKQKDLWVSAHLPKAGLTAVMDKYWPDLEFEQAIEPGGAGENPAVEFVLTAMGSDVNGWLAAGVSGKEEIAMGPMTIRLAEASGPIPAELSASAAGPNVLVLSDLAGKESVEITATDGNSKEFTIGGKKLKVMIRQTFGNFSMDGKDFNDRPGAPENPAVAYLVEGPDGKTPDIAFANYPDFSLQHGKKQALFKARYHFKAGAHEPDNRLTLWWLDKKKLAYSVRVGGKPAGSGDVVEGKRLDLMNGRIGFTVKKLMKGTRVVQKAVNASDEARNPSIHVKLVPDAGGEGAGVWLPWGEQRELSVNGKKLTLLYRGDRYDVPFSLKLLKFKEDKYPGSMQSATYESKVKLEDKELGRNEELVISMNEPLLYRGYTFFQSSFIPGESYTTVLSVSRDPGKWPTYIGYILMTIGMLLMFYAKPFLARWDQARLKKEKAQ